MVNLLPYYAAGGDHPRHVSGDEPHSVAHFSDHIGRRADPEASGDMGRNGAEELPHGVFLEYVRSSTARSSDI